MTKKTKDRAGWYQATSNISKSTCNYNSLASRIKAFIVTLALWGLLPVAVEDWLVNRGELRDE